MRIYILPLGSEAEVWVEDVGWNKVKTSHSAFLTAEDLVGRAFKESELEKYVGNRNLEGYFMFHVEGVTFQVSSKELMVWKKT